MTNIDPAFHPDSWDFPARPFIIKPWLGKTSVNGYETLPDVATTPTPHADTFDPLLPELASHPAVPADIAKLELLPEHSSSYQSCDEDWRIYLADGPFDHPMDDLDDPGNSLEFAYPPDELDDANISDHFVSEQLLFSAVPNFPTRSFESLPSAKNSPPEMTTASPPLLVIPSPERNFAVDLQQDTPRHNASVCIPNGTYASLMELTPPAFDFGSARFSSLEAPSRPSESSHVSPASSPHRRGRSPTITRRGLSGWGDSQYLQVPTPSVIVACRKRLRSPTNSPCSSVRRPYTTSPLGSILGSEESSSTHDSKRSKRSKASRGSSSLSLPGSVIGTEYPESEADEFVVDDDSDSDDYRPSRSSSVDPDVASSFSRALPLLPDVRPVPSKQKSTTMTRRGKGKAKGSAALALAVVTQLGGGKGRVKSEDRDGDDDNDGEDNYDPLTLYREGRYGIRKKKNNPIPLPVPVPNLNKKSRGRKVPYLAGAVKVEDGRSPSTEGSTMTEDLGSVASSVGVGAVSTTRIRILVVVDLVGNWRGFLRPWRPSIRLGTGPTFASLLDAENVSFEGNI
ncbi:hypothetical protein M413DRAFT_12833 [Hebeloma cylindrosporum]|uniref:Uncharacterized protein n=1 Tax=Hebeloma cylindrosporum TaxID=76867 RepID=A0A0C2XKT7_HEBCY|nr:hypothetical protein M413DRAFT_12833 [Hebeloma cylindrosporum h7]